VTARLGWKVSRIKMGSGDLGNLLALETLSLGIGGKAGIRKSLKEVCDENPRLASVDLDVLISGQKNGAVPRSAEGSLSPPLPWATRRLPDTCG